MREILFRGKRCKGGEWVVGSYYKQKEFYGTPFESHVIITSTDDLEYDQALEFHCVQPETVGQFTGLTDKNGTKIFEGDVFKFPDEIFESYYTSCGTEYNSWEIENCGVVGYDEYYGRYDFVRYRFGNNAVEADLHENKDIDFADFVRELEVIGNIHDNPELLENITHQSQ